MPIASEFIFEVFEDEFDFAYSASVGWVMAFIPQAILSMSFAVKEAVERNFNTTMNRPRG